MVGSPVPHSPGGWAGRSPRSPSWRTAARPPRPTTSEAWAEGTGQPDAYDELLARLRGFESHIRSWRRQLASGHKPVQDTHLAAHVRRVRVPRLGVVHGSSGSSRPRLRPAIFTRYAELQQSPRDTEDAVRSRMQAAGGAVRPCEALPPPSVGGRAPGARSVRRRYWPHSSTGCQACRSGHGGAGHRPAQCESLKIPPATAFWVYDDSRVIVETWHSELWVEDETSVSTYLRTWNTLRESAVYGADAHRLISDARRALSV
jgi:hypothetical protein